jgi:hypothetical protein
VTIEVGEVDAPFARELGDKRKVVASNRPLDSTSRNAEVLPGDLVRALIDARMQELGTS